ncbi:MAG TPA: glycosyl hydrolase 115 family protein [Bacteroidota bacterium]|nr:glycosyl hydrolase 115 family protein [Bacteroidota bacterium]
MPFIHHRLLSFLSIILIWTASQSVFAVDRTSMIATEKISGGFALSASGKSAPLCFSSQDYPGVVRVVKQLQDDIDSVTNARPMVCADVLPASDEIVLIGTAGKNPFINKLVEEKKINLDDVNGRWEKFIIQTVDHPFPNIARALVIVGSDKRGTIYGMYELSEKIGVSPWIWWADVPVKKSASLFVQAGRYTLGEPAVKYRGIFINDEAPALAGWAHEKFHGLNHQFYTKVFDLILRLKGNYLWPAMWGNAFNDDDTLNPRLADEYGIVMGTSHHEPMLRAQQEWKRYGSGAWDYQTNESTLKAFWKKGIQNMGNHESIVTIGMRGDGDMPMSETANISLLEKIVDDQRKILSEVTGKDVTTIPQLWALYKEVQEYYDKGMRVPDDVTLLLCDDNWGNLRKLPLFHEKPRSGGYGIYYHFDYVGGPRNYKWLNTNQIERTWEQMHLAYSYGVKQVWIVNVGDIKPMEFPISFFLDYAWNPDQWNAGQLQEYTTLWAEQQFGPDHAKDIAEILTQYTKFNARRKPELLGPDTYSLTNYREAETVVAEYKALATKAQRLADELPVEDRDAYFQLVLHPVLACSNLNELWVTVGKNHLYAKQGRAATNDLAEEARNFFERDSLISYTYNHVIANGKWNHMMDQTHISYTYWQQPEQDVLPAVQRLTLPHVAEMGVAIEGSSSWWPDEKKPAELPEFDKYHHQSYYIDVFNRGSVPFTYSVQVEKPWMVIDSANGTIETERRLQVAIAWDKVPAGEHRAAMTIKSSDGKQVMVNAFVSNPAVPKPENLNGFVESNGYVSVEAEHYTSAIATPPMVWQDIPNLSRTRSGMTILPVTASAQTPGGDSPHLEYSMYLFHGDSVQVDAYCCPTLNFHGGEGLRYAISIDDEQPQIVALHTNSNEGVWNKSVANNIVIAKSKHKITHAGFHVLKFWTVDPAVVLQKIVVETGDVKPSYLGPPESFRFIK